MSGSPRRATSLRVLGVVAITTVITLAAACSDQDTVDTVPPPWPTRTVKAPGPTPTPHPTSTTATVTRAPTSPIQPTSTSRPTAAAT